MKVVSSCHLAIMTVQLLVINQHLQKVSWQMPTFILSLHNLLLKTDYLQDRYLWLYPHQRLSQGTKML